MYALKYPRGSIWYMDDGIDKRQYSRDSVTVGRRPILIVSNDRFNMYSPVVNYIPLTTKNKRNSPVHVEISNISNQISYAQCEQISTVSKDRLMDFIAMAPSDLMDKLEQALLYQLGMDSYSKNSNLDSSIKKINECLDNYVDSLNKQYGSIVQTDYVLDNIIKQIDEATNKLHTSIDIKSLKTESIHKKRTIRKEWNEEDKRFILDNFHTNLSSILKKYNMSRSNAYRLYKKWSDEQK